MNQCFLLNILKKRLINNRDNTQLAVFQLLLFAVIVWAEINSVWVIYEYAENLLLSNR